MRLTDGPWPVWEILPGQLYQRGQLHGKDAGVKKAGVDHFGITHAIALAPKTPDPDLPLMIDYHHLPVPDGLLRENGPKFQRFAAYLADEIRDNDAVVMTMCHAGRNRSGLMSALILMELMGISGTSAIKIVRMERPRALANPHFEAFLKEIR